MITTFWWVYILRCGDGTLYTGITTDVAFRLAQHRSGQGAKCTRGRGNLELVYRERVGTRSEASQRELVVKRMTREAKPALIFSAISANIGHASEV